MFKSSDKDKLLIRFISYIKVFVGDKEQYSPGAVTMNESKCAVSQCLLENYLICSGS